jgi:hypothetical protein
VHDASATQIPSLRLSERIHEVITRSIQPPIDRFQDVGQRTIESLQKIANEMGRNDSPSKKDFELLLRDLPWFELAALPSPFTVTL